MKVNYDSITALGRAQVALCEQLAWLALEGFERAHRMNMDAFESFWERRIGEAKAATGIEQARPRGAPTPALWEQWIRINETAAYLNREFGRVAGEYAGELRNALFSGGVALGPEPGAVEGSRPDRRASRWAAGRLSESTAALPHSMEQAARSAVHSIGDG